MRPVSHDRVLRDVGRRISEIRRARSLTQEQFAEQLDVSVRYIQLVEAGNENLTVETMVKFSNALHVPVATLFERPTAPKTRAGRPKGSA